MNTSTMSTQIEGATFPCMAYPTDREMTVGEAFARYMELRTNEGSWSLRTDHQKRVVNQLGRGFIQLLGSRRLREIRPDDLRAWLLGLRHRKSGARLNPVTLRHYFKEVKIFFKRAVLEEWIEKNPTIPVRTPQVPDKPVNIISAKDAFHVFKTNVDHRCIGRLALEAFGGVRFSTAARLSKEDIKFERRGIDMPANKHKSGKRQFRQGHPDNLWAWLRHAPEEGWSIDWRTTRNGKMEMHWLAGLRKTCGLHSRGHKRGADFDERKRLEALHNVWRHSFASYLLAIEKAYPKVSYLMQHTRPSTTEIYEGVADEVEAKLYFAITPEAVRSMTWEEFRKWVLAPSYSAEPESRDSHAAIGRVSFQSYTEPVAQRESNERAWLAE